MAPPTAGPGETLLPLQPGQKTVVYGGGGHGRVVADAAAALGADVLGFLDDGLPVGHPVLGWTVLGNLDWLRGRAGLAVALGIGDNTGRVRVAHALLALGGVHLPPVVHPAAVVSRYAVLGAGVVVFAQAVVNPGANVGLGAIVNTGAVVEHDVLVGDFAHVAPRAALAGGARLGELALLGTGASVLPGRTVGPRSVVGAGGVVVRDVPADSVAVGVPARVIRGGA